MNSRFSLPLNLLAAGLVLLASILAPQGVDASSHREAAFSTLIITPNLDTLGNATVTQPDGVSARTSCGVDIETQQLALRQMVRDTFADGPKASPSDLNSRAFVADAAGDVFTDLLTQQVPMSDWM